jgi:hypothetical protein
MAKKQAPWSPKPSAVPLSVRVFRCTGCRYITQGPGPLCRICVSKGIEATTIVQAQPHA